MAVVGFFGEAVALDGTMAIVGAPITGSSEQGAVYLLDLDEGGAPSVAQTLATADARAFLGTDVAVMGDTIAAGAPSARVGSVASGRNGTVYLYARNPATGVVDSQCQVGSPDQHYQDHFGQRVAITGNWLVVTAPFDDSESLNGGAVYLFEVQQACSDGAGGSSRGG